MNMDHAGRADELITADEVAAMLSVTRAWVYSETRRGAMPHVRLGRYVRFRRDALETWVREIEQGARPAAHRASRR
jgi:excisionase family DNA binding protein